MKVLVTGANGFIGKNLLLKLNELKDIQVLQFTRQDTSERLRSLVLESDFVFHLAGVNRPKNETEFTENNANLTRLLADAAKDALTDYGKKIPIVYSSSIQADNNSPYGDSKLAAEQALRELADTHGVPVYIYRLPNVFGKWSRPNYNSAVATFCHNISRGLPIEIRDRDAIVHLVYIDDVIETFCKLLDSSSITASLDNFTRVDPVYSITLGALADLLYSFQNGRKTLVTERVGTGLTRALYSTFVSFLPTEAFCYPIPKHGDSRGVFVEMLKMQDSGQFSYFTAHPGITRGGHYHHSKVEKFLVIKGKAKFRFRHMATTETYELTTSGENPEIVETIPGWTHDITNIGNEEMVVMLWANEVFDRDHPDTYFCPL